MHFLEQGYAKFRSFKYVLRVKNVLGVLPLLFLFLGFKSHVSVRYLTETFTVEITFNCVPINILLQCFEWVERVTPYNMLLVNIQSHKANINEYFAIREIQRKGIKVKATEDINMRFNDSERYIAVRPLRCKGIKVKATEDINMRFNDSLRYISASAFNKKAIRVMVAER